MFPLTIRASCKVSLLIVMGAHASSTWQERLFAGIAIVLMTNYKYNPHPQDVEIYDLSWQKCDRHRTNICMSAAEAKGIVIGVGFFVLWGVCKCVHVSLKG